MHITRITSRDEPLKLEKQQITFLFHHTPSSHPIYIICLSYNSCSQPKVKDIDSLGSGVYTNVYNYTKYGVLYSETLTVLGGWDGGDWYLDGYFLVVCTYCFPMGWEYTRAREEENIYNIFVFGILK